MENNENKFTQEDIIWIISEYTEELNSWKQDNLELMKKQLTELHNLDNNNIDILRFLWRVLWDLQDKEWALEYAGKANKILEGKDSWFLYDLWRLNFELWNVEEWKKYIEEAVRVNPANNLALSYLENFLN